MACVRKYRGHWVVDWRDPITKKRAIEAVEEDTRRPRSGAWQRYSRRASRSAARRRLRNTATGG